MLSKCNILGFMLWFQLFLGQAPPSQHKFEQINELMGTYHDNGYFNGSVLVAAEGKILYQKGFGLANMEWHIPNQWDTKHRLGSISKQFTAMLILQLVQEGHLSLDIPIAQYLTDYLNPMGEKITIHHLLTHSAGIMNYTLFPNFIQDMSRNSFSPKEFAAIFSKADPQFEPGEKFSYSNSDYFLLGVLIEKITGKSYETVLKEKILEPLGMQNTGYDHHETILENRASGYEKHGHGYKNADYLDMSIPYAAGAMYSTVYDLFLWDQALYTDQLLSKENMDLMFSPHIAAWGNSYGYGWTVSDKKSNPNEESSSRIVGHSGVINGFNTLISRDISNKNLVVLLNNTGMTTLENIANDVRNVLNAKPYNLPKKSLANTLLFDIRDQGIAKALELFSNNKKSDNFVFSEAEMNTMGYQLLYFGKTEDAIAVFKLNVAEFPTSWNVYDSLGEAYVQKGNVPLAIKNYKKSIQINPYNSGGIKILKKLEEL